MLGVVVVAYYTVAVPVAAYALWCVYAEASAPRNDAADIEMTRLPPTPRKDGVEA